MKVTEAIGSEDTTVSKIDLELDPSLPQEVQDDIKDEVGQFVKEQVLLSLHDAQSPVSGEKWPALSPKYKKYKESQGGTAEANMELYGDMLDDFDYASTEDGFDIGFMGSEQAWKADGHLKFSGAEGTAPRRRFLPGEGQSFKSTLEKGVDRIIADHMGSQIVASDFKDITTSTQLYSELEDLFGDMSDKELKLAALRSPEIYDILAEEDLLNLL